MSNVKKHTVRRFLILTAVLTAAAGGLNASAPAPARAAYTGLGFDACAAPSAATMTAWLASPYRAIGIYVGGGNRGCSQPNLTSAWIDAQAAAGWTFIPTYVGLQAPGSSCGSCDTINPKRAADQGKAEAQDAVAQMQALGLGAGNPVYFDMEHYQRGGSNTLATLAFLGAWTEQLHRDGYVSGVYSSASSGIRDLVDAYGTGFVEPDAIWIANWNKQQSTSDPYVPDAYWANRQRIHQYRGGHKEKWGGVTINIDNNYIDGPVAPQNALPKVSRRPAVRVRSRAKRQLIVSRGKWSGLAPISYAYQWMRCNKRAAKCSAIGGATHETYKPRRRDVGSRLKVVVTATNELGSRRANAVTRGIKRNRLP